MMYVYDMFVTYFLHVRLYVHVQAIFAHVRLHIHNNLAGVFYYFLGNIEPKLRSALKCIQLIACITTQNLEKYGFEVILEPFIRDANKLSEVSL